MLPRLRSLVLGGEAVCLPDVARFLSARCAPNVRVVNMYGITETTVHVTFRELSGTETGGQPGSTPIGLPIPSLRLSLRDEHGAPVQPGAPGELWVSGAGTCAGYLNRPELTGRALCRRRPGSDLVPQRRPGTVMTAASTTTSGGSIARCSCAATGLSSAR